MPAASAASISPTCSRSTWAPRRTWRRCSATSLGLSVAEYPTEHRAEIEVIIAQWRPEVWARATEAACADRSASWAERRRQTRRGLRWSPSSVRSPDRPGASSRHAPSCRIGSLSAGRLSHSGCGLGDLQDRGALFSGRPGNCCAGFSSGRSARPCRLSPVASRCEPRSSASPRVCCGLNRRPGVSRPRAAPRGGRPSPISQAGRRVLREG